MTKEMSIWVFAVILALAVGALPVKASPYHSAIQLSNGRIKIEYTNEAVGVANYTDNSLEPGGWELYPSVYWDGNGNGAFEDGESVVSTIFPVVHFTKDSQQYCFAPLHQSIMAQGDAQITSSGWVSPPNVYASEVKDSNSLVRVKSTISIFTGNNYFKQEIAVNSTASTTLTNVTLIVYLGIDINGFLNDQAFIDAGKNNMLKAHDTGTGTWFGAYPNRTADTYEVSQWNDGPSPQDDCWQHTLNNTLNGATSSSGDVEGALGFNLGEISPGQTKTIKIHYILGHNESDLTVSANDVAVNSVTTCKDGANNPFPSVGRYCQVHINATVQNQGDQTETFNVTIYASNTTISTAINQTQLVLSSAASVLIQYRWNATLPYGNYTISAVADTVLGETDTADNTFVGRTVLVTIPGDVTGDLKVQPGDLAKLIAAYGSPRGIRPYNPNCDINDDHSVGPGDLAQLIAHYGQHYP